VLYVLRFFVTLFAFIRKGVSFNSLCTKISVQCLIHAIKITHLVKDIAHLIRIKLP